MATGGAESAARQALRERLLAANVVMRYDYAWKELEFRGAESRLVGVASRLLYLHATWLLSHDVESARARAFVRDNGFSEFSAGVKRACELMGYELAPDAVSADVVFLYVAPPSEARVESSQYELVEEISKHFRAQDDRQVNAEPLVFALLGEAEFLERPHTDEADRLRGLSDFAISQQMRPLMEAAGYDTVAQFAVEFVPAHTENLSDEFKAEKDERLSGLMNRFGVLDMNMMHHTEKWEVLAPVGSVFAHAQEDADGITHVGDEEAMYWVTVGRKHACDQCLLFTSKLSFCARCHEAVYCSRECQKAAWKLHKQVCAKPNA